MNIAGSALGRVAVGLLLCTSLAQAAEEGSAAGMSWEDERDHDELAKRERVMGERFRRDNDAAYARSLMAAAARERETNARLMVGAKVDDITLGEVWTNLGPSRMSSGPMDSGRVSAIATHPDNSNIVYVASAGGGVWRSLDAGASWKAMTDTLGSLGTGALALDANLPNRLYLGLGDAHKTGYLAGPSTSLGTAPGLGVLKSSDGGVTWSAPILLGDSTSIRKIVVSPNNSNLILVATDQGLYRSTNAGASYQLQPLGAGDGKPEVWSIAWSGSNRFAATTKDGSGGKIWFSSEQAAGWTPSNGLPSAVGRITIASAPSSPNIQYALTYHNVTALTEIYKSTDGGQDWSSLNVGQESYVNNVEPVRKLLGTSESYNQMVVVNPTTPNIAYFGGQLRLARTGDGGATFSLVNSTTRSAQNYVHPDFHAAAYDAANRLYVGNDGGVFRSGDAGQTWTPRNDGLITHLVYGVASSVDDLGELLVALQDNGILHSANSGTDNAHMAGGDGFWALLSQNDAGKLIIATNGGTYQSDDGGLSGGELAFDGIPNGAASFIDQSPAVASGETLHAASGGKIYRSTDFGKHWQAVAMNGLVGSVRWVRAGRNSGVLVAIVGYAPGQIWFTLDNGAHWTQAPTPANADGSFLDAAVGDDNQFYVISDGYREGKSRIWSSFDPAGGWAFVGWGGLPTGVRLNALKADPVRNGTIYVATDLGMYRSTNKGLTFTRLGAGLPLVSVSDIWIARDGSRLRVGTYGRGVWNLVLAN
ncbi:WD40/YVTN/BNR-like repeat-containing protein [Tahibacter caeni]|uniref:WD40/YVTN/BNR-like repeat-containing protein n=1 Tax=Tahibacter caeni TaxID=1453545 RepID=UPI0021485782|nr:hypothetical protein [Tahibacter caeni]